jgi:NhaP-type Na+/H+ or K+/H+ antiporter
MLLNLSIIIVVALLLNYSFTKLKLPGLIGMISTGIILGPSCLDFISPQILDISGELKTAALIVILIRAGLGINKTTLNKVGVPAMKMSCIPGILEGITVTVVSHYLLGLSYIESGMLGFIIAAVSPAVVVPQMLEIKELGLGQKKEIPTLVLAGASIDDVFAITIFGVFLDLGMKNVSSDYYTLAYKVPLGVIAGVVIGLGIGYLFVKFFSKVHTRDTKKVLIFMIISILFHDTTNLEQVKEVLPIASLIGIMAIGFIILEKNEDLAHRLAAKFNRVWVLAEILLFVLIGSQVKIEALNMDIIFYGLLILVLGLTARSLGVMIALAGSELNMKEKLFCVIAYIPKATVQAAIGAVPLTMIMQGNMNENFTVADGNIILAMAVLSIIITAPIGAIGIKLGAPKLLNPS